MKVRCAMLRSRLSTHQRVRLVGWIVGAAGWIAAAVVFVSAGPEDGGDGLGELARRRKMQQLERLGGRASVQATRLDEWLSSLWHGRRLAGTLAVLSLAAAAGCLYVGGLMAEDVDEG